MGFRIDLHLHTNRYSACSSIPPEKLIKQAIKAGLQGMVITEHHHIWAEEELEELKDLAGEPTFTLLSGFEYTSRKGDILIYGLSPAGLEDFPLRLEPEEAVEKAHSLGAVCIAAHPTRAGLGFDERLESLPVNGIEVQSVNLANHEQRLALHIAEATNRRPTASSDAHRIQDVGAYSTYFEDPISTIHDFVEAVESGRFGIV